MSNLQISDIDKVSVFYKDKLVGELALDANGVSVFEYSPGWIAEGFSISPLFLPLESCVFVANPRKFDGLFGVFNDSLPDGWGRLLLDRSLAQQGINPESVGPLARLCIVGSSGMGALEYRPNYEIEDITAIKDLDEISQQSLELLRSDNCKDLDALYAMGGSSGGARPKIFANIDGEDWIIKFPSHLDKPDIGEEEFRISELARNCGLEMPPTKLFPSKICKGYFGVKRFDRVASAGKTEKIHVVSASGLLETSHRVPNLSYELLLRLTWKICGSLDEVVRMYRLMCFNVAIGNKDDHAKNFAFI